MSENESRSSGQDSDVSRREFIGSAALTSAGAAVGLSAYFSRPKAREFPSDPVSLGYIGVGRRGGALLRSSVQVPGNHPGAVADVQPGARNQAIKDIQKQHGKDHKVKSYKDYRELLDDKEVEGVFIAGVLAAGNNANKIFIENGKHHGGLIVEAFLARRRAEAISRGL